MFTQHLFNKMYEKKKRYKRCYKETETNQKTFHNLKYFKVTKNAESAQRTNDVHSEVCDGSRRAVIIHLTQLWQKPRSVSVLLFSRCIAYTTLAEHRDRPVSNNAKDQSLQNVEELRPI